MENYDLIVIGAGPGGYVAAIRASQLGAKVAVIEKEEVGGVCLNWGCIPTKALLKSAEIYSTIKKANHYGINAEKVSFDIKSIVDHSINISKQLTGGINSLLKKNKISLIQGEAKFISSSEISVKHEKNENKYSAKKFIIATGARAKILPGFEPDGDRIWTYRAALRPKTIPNSMVIVGSGAIGMEFASFYNSLGVDVTVIEYMNNILPSEDKEISKLAQKSFEKKGIKFILSAKISKQSIINNKVKAEYLINDKSEQIETDILLMAIGVSANVENIGLENTRVSLKNNLIETNKFMQTADANIYAIGDVTAGPWLAHKASHEGVIAAEALLGKANHPMNKKNIPACTYATPEIASVGMREDEAIAAGHEINIGRFPFFANGKALISGDSDGLIKTIFDKKTGELLGAHMIGSGVTELIHGYVIGKEAELVEKDFMQTIFPHPTLSEMMHESVLSAYLKAIHI